MSDKWCSRHCLKQLFKVKIQYPKLVSPPLHCMPCYPYFVSKHRQKSGSGAHTQGWKRSKKTWFPIQSSIIFQSIPNPVFSRSYPALPTIQFRSDHDPFYTSTRHSFKNYGAKDFYKYENKWFSAQLGMGPGLDRWWQTTAAVPVFFRSHRIWSSIPIIDPNG